MLNDKLVCVVVPAYNEADQILKVVESMPDFVDRIVVVNDCSTDQTSSILQSAQNNSAPVAPLPDNQSKKVAVGPIDYSRADVAFEGLLAAQSKSHTQRKVMAVRDKRLVVINHQMNGGVGAAIASGYLWARENHIFCTAVMAGDGQMDPEELEGICNPIVFEDYDYVKGNRLKHPAALEIIPRTRLFGNSILSILTKISSGYWKVSDTQTGYTTISLNALRAIKLNEIYPRYGMPNDMLVKLNIQNCKLKEVIIKPVYDIGEQSKMKIHKVIPKIGWLLFKGFWRRILIKYLIREFHPLFLLYIVGMASLLVAIAYLSKIGYLWIWHIRPINELTILAFLFTFLFGFQSLLFAMWMDIQDNEGLNK